MDARNSDRWIIALADRSNRRGALRLLSGAPLAGTLFGSWLARAALARARLVQLDLDGDGPLDDDETVDGVVAEEGISDLVAGNTAFALNLYAAMRHGADGNLLFAPYSISQALAMSYAGASGETAAQMEETLSFKVAQPALPEAFSTLTSDLIARGTAEDDSGEGRPVGALLLANALWGERTYPFNPSYDAEIERYYGAGVHESDFLNAPEESREQINEWVAEQTEDRIPAIVPEGAITPDTRLVLANAIWFSGRWSRTFDPDATRDGDFFLLDGTTLTVPFMVRSIQTQYARHDDVQVIEFRYEESGFAFTVILSDEGRFEAFEEEFDADELNAAIRLLASTHLMVHLPRFGFESSAVLTQTLQTMGMVDAFDPRRADFTGMVDGTPARPLSISDVLHKGFISVDELGTEAAAATVALVASISGEATLGEPFEVRIDRPFIFALRDTQTGTLLFVGRVLNPVG